MEKRYNDLNTYFRKMFGCRVQKITVDAGLTCPNRDGSTGTGGCIYCNVRGSGTGAWADGKSVTVQLLEGKKVLTRRYKAKKFIAYFQSYSNTYAPIRQLKRLYDEALSVEDVIGLSIGTRPDCADTERLSFIQDYTQDYLIWIEYGLQSADDDTLTFINRGHDVNRFVRAVQDTKNRGIKICAHVILGLPHEDRSHMLKTAQMIADLGIDGVKLHLLYVVKGTPMEKLYRRGKYRCLDQVEYVELVCDFLERIPASVVIQRLTGDPHRDELVAPAWSQRKSETLALINETLKERNSRQGKFTS